MRRNSELPKVLFSPWLCDFSLSFNCIGLTSDLRQWENMVDEKYPHVVYEERCKAYDKEFFEPTTENDGLDELEGLWLPIKYTYY